MNVAAGFSLRWRRLKPAATGGFSPSLVCRRTRSVAAGRCCAAPGRQSGRPHQQDSASRNMLRGASRDGTGDRQVRPLPAGRFTRCRLVQIGCADLSGHTGLVRDAPPVPNSFRCWGNAGRRRGDIAPEAEPVTGSTGPRPVGGLAGSRRAADASGGQIWSSSARPASAICLPVR